MFLLHIQTQIYEFLLFRLLDFPGDLIERFVWTELIDTWSHSREGRRANLVHSSSSCGNASDCFGRGRLPRFSRCPAEPHKRSTGNIRGGRRAADSPRSLRRHGLCTKEEHDQEWLQWVDVHESARGQGTVFTTERGRFWHLARGKRTTIRIFYHEQDN